MGTAEQVIPVEQTLFFSVYRVRSGVADCTATVAISFMEMLKMIGLKLHPVLSTLHTLNCGFYGFVASLKYTDTKSLRLKLSLNYSDCSRPSEICSMTLNNQKSILLFTRKSLLQKRIKDIKD